MSEGEANLLPHHSSPPEEGAGNSEANERRVLILAPTGNDANLTAGFLTQAGIQTRICANMRELVREIGLGCGAIVVGEETLNAVTEETLKTALANQPSWSDIPVGLVTSGHPIEENSRSRVHTFGRETNVTVLERPFRPFTLVRTVEVALRTRHRQYQVRDLWTVLKSSELRVRRLLEQNAMGLAELDLEGRFTMVNDQFCHVVGRSRHDLLKLRILDITYPDDAELGIARRQVLISGQANSSVIEKRYLRPDGSPVWVQDHLSAIRDFTGKLVGIAVASAEITERKKAEEEAKAARDEAVAASQAKDMFLAALSHELRTPLNPVLLLASEGAGNLDYPRTARADFDMIARNVSLEARLFDDLLDLTRITRGKLSLDRQPHDVRNTLNDAIATVDEDLRQKQIHLRKDFASEPAVVAGDPVRLQQVFWNVLKNAVKFTPMGGSITVSTRMIGNQIVVTVTDTGIGMTSQELDRIFNSFAQGDHASNRGAHRYGGLGLGLAISKTLIEAHGGKIAAASAGRDTGSTFTIELPVIRASPVTLPATPADPSASQPPFESTGAKTRVLVVEDHEPTRTALARLLMRRKFQVLTAGTVGEALAIASKANIELILSDIGLPDGTGYDLMRQLRVVHGLRGIALTGYGQDQDIAQSRAAGFSAHLTKPVDVRSLDRTLAELEMVPTLK